MTHVTASFEMPTNGFRWRVANTTVGLNADSGWAAAAGANPSSLDAGRSLYLRIEAEEVNGASGSITPQWEYRYKPSGGSFGSWTAMPETSVDNVGPIMISPPLRDSAGNLRYTNPTATTSLTLSGSSRAFVAGSGDFDKTIASVSLNNERSQWEICLMVMRSYYNGSTVAYVGDNDEIEIRITDNGTVLDNYPTTLPKITVNVPTGLVGGTIPETNNRIVWADTNGNVYAGIEPYEAPGPPLIMMKSADDGDGWTEQDGSNRPAETDVEVLDGVYASNEIFMVHHGGGDVYHHSFRTSDHATNADTWNTRGQSIAASISLNTGQQAAAIERFANGDLMIFYNRANSTDDHLYYKYNTGAGWSAEQSLYTTTGEHVHWVSAVRDSDDVVHVFYHIEKASTGPIEHVSFASATASPSTAETVDSNVGISNSYDAPFPAPVAWDSGADANVTLMFIDNGDDNLYSVEIANDGSPQTRQQVSDRTVSVDPDDAAFPTGGDEQPAASGLTGGAGHGFVCVVRR